MSNQSPVRNPLHFRHRRRPLGTRKGHRLGFDRTVAGRPRLPGADPEVRSLPQRRPRHDEPVPARRGLRHRGRRRDRPRPRPLRALHRREHLAGLERHRRLGLQLGDPPRASRRLPRRHRPGDPPHHRRDQEPDPDRRRDQGGRLRDHRDRRHRRRHRVPAFPRGDPPALHRADPEARDVRPPDPGSLHQPRRGDEDQADPALGQRTAPDRHPAPRADLPLGHRARPQHPGEDRPLRQPSGRRRDLRAGRRQRLQDPADVPGRRGRRLHPRPLPDRRRADARPDRVGRDAAHGRPRRGHGEHRTGRQVRAAGRLLQVGDRGARARRHPQRGQGRGQADRLRRFRPGARWKAWTAS